MPSARSEREVARLAASPCGLEVTNAGRRAPAGDILRRRARVLFRPLRAAIEAGWVTAFRTDHGVRCCLMSLDLVRPWHMSAFLDQCVSLGCLQTRHAVVPTSRDVSGVMLGGYARVKLRLVASPSQHSGYRFEGGMRGHLLLSAGAPPPSAAHPSSASFC